MNLLANTIKTLLAKKENITEVEYIILILDIQKNTAVGKIKGKRNGGIIEQKMEEGNFPAAVTDNFFFKRWLQKIKEETSEKTNVVVIYLDYIGKDYYLKARWSDANGLPNEKKFFL